MTVTLTVTPKELPFTENAEIIIEATADPQTDFELLDYTQTIAAEERPFEYRVVRLDRQPIVSFREGKNYAAQRFRLEFFLPGEYPLPGAAVRIPAQAVPEAQPGQSDTGAVELARKELKTEPVLVVAAETAAASLTAEELAQLKILPPVELREPWTVWHGILALLLIAAIIAAAVFWNRRRTARAQRTVQIPAHEWFHGEVARLIAEELVPRGLIQEFHYRISDVLRGYIERRYRVLAREMTTEEFLTTISTDARFDREAATSLSQFLHACDLVKYAKHPAATAEANALLQAADGFVERTRVRELRIDGKELPVESRREDAA